MKPLLRSMLLIVLLMTALQSKAQIIVQGVSPAPIVSSYNFSWGDPTGGDWASPNFNIPGTFVQDTIMLVEDGTGGTSPQGNPVSQEGCNALINNLTGKIAVIYRNSCEFSLKVLNAQNAGAVAVIIINNQPTVVGIAGGTYGLSITIPVVMISSTDGGQLVTEMGNGPVVMFLGNKIGAFANDIGASSNSALVSNYGGAYEEQFDGFDLGIEIYNFGQSIQNNATVQATIDGPGGNVFDETIALASINPGDSVSIFNGNTYQFSSFTLGGIGSYPAGLYTLTYTLVLGVVDDSGFDNVLVSTFTVNNQTLALSNVDLVGLPEANSYPSNSTTEYQSCTMVQDTNVSSMLVEGMYFIPHTDTSINDLTGAEIFVNAYQWDDAWVDLDDPSYQFDPFTNDAFQNLNLLTFGTHYPLSNNEVDDVAYASFGTSFTLQDNVRYLFCLQTFESVTVSFGYDNTIDYDGNEAEYRQPISPVHVDGNWFVGGWNGMDAPSLALKISDCPLLTIDTTQLVETCFGQSNGVISVDATGFSGPVSYLWTGGSTNDTISNLAGGMYTVTASDSAGCSMSASFTVNEFSEMDLVLEAFDETCDLTNDGSAGVFSFAGGQAVFSFLWNTGDTTVSISGLDNGVYTLTITDALGCPVEETISVGIGAPDFSLTPQANPTFGNPPLDVTFENQTPNASNYNFTWVFGDGNSEVNNSSTLQHTYQTVGIWDALLIAEDIVTGCIDTLELDNYIITSGVSIPEIDKNDSFSIHPNPNDGIFVLKTNELVSSYDVKIFNAQGKVVLSSSFYGNETSVDIQGVDSGIYYIQLQSETSQQVSKIVKR